MNMAPVFNSVNKPMMLRLPILICSIQVLTNGLLLSHLEHWKNNKLYHQTQGNRITNTIFNNVPPPPPPPPFYFELWVIFLQLNYFVAHLGHLPNLRKRKQNANFIIQDNALPSPHHYFGACRCAALKC